MLIRTLTRHFVGVGWTEPTPTLWIAGSFFCAFKKRRTPRPVPTIWDSTRRKACAIGLQTSIAVVTFNVLLRPVPPRNLRTMRFILKSLSTPKVQDRKRTRRGYQISIKWIEIIEVHIKSETVASPSSLLDVLLGWESTLEEKLLSLLTYALYVLLFCALSYCMILQVY